MPLRVPFAARAAPADVLFSSVFAPGGILVVDPSRHVAVFPIAFAREGSPLLRGDPEPVATLPGMGAATALGECPNAADPDSPFLAVGTHLGELVVFARGMDPAPPLEILPCIVPCIRAVAQVGHFSFAAVTAGQVHLVIPDSQLRIAGLQPMLEADLSDSRRMGLSDIGVRRLDRFAMPAVDPICVPIAAGNGMAEDALLDIPAMPGLGGALMVRAVDPICVPIRQLDLGSLVLLTADGSGVLYNPGFTLEGGLAGPVFTLAGTAGGRQRPGDCNQDGEFDISDAICLLGHLFLGAPAELPCEGGTAADPQNVALLDLNGDRGIDLSDPVHGLSFLFQGGGPPLLGGECVRLVGCPDRCGSP
jgi:hypothetical protein